MIRKKKRDQAKVQFLAAGLVDKVQYLVEIAALSELHYELIKLVFTEIYFCKSALTLKTFLICTFA